MIHRNPDSAPPAPHRRGDELTTAELFLEDVQGEMSAAERARSRARAYLDRRRQKLRAQRQRQQS